MAEEIKYRSENVSTGPASDLNAINQLARQMVKSGFDRRTGFFQHSNGITSSKLAKQNFEEDVQEFCGNPRIKIESCCK